MPTITHTVNRIVLDAKCSFEEFRKRYEAAVPPLDQQLLASLVQQGKNWNDITSDVNTRSPSGFFVFWQMDVMPTMRPAGHEGNCVEYLMGNYTIAERMFRWDRSVMLHAPLRTLIYTDDNGKARFAMDQPSSVFSSFNSDAIAEVGEELDRKLGALFITLDISESVLLA
jgi:uncharacterized protein (DUF302 family)